jgi:hypothetical protein
MAGAGCTTQSVVKHLLLPIEPEQWFDPLFCPAECKPLAVCKACTLCAAASASMLTQHKYLILTAAEPVAGRARDVPGLAT